MATIRVTKEFHFEAAHALFNYNGKCKNMHGHSYKLLITTKGTPISIADNPKLGMVIDFVDLKSIINDIIIQKFDHSVILNKNASYNMHIEPYAKNIEVMQSITP